MEQPVKNEHEGGRKNGLGLRAEQKVKRVE